MTLALKLAKFINKHKSTLSKEKYDELLNEAQKLKSSVDEVMTIIKVI